MADSGIDMEWCECENAIEWLDGQKTATVTIHSEKLRNRVMRLAEEYPDKIKVIAEPKKNGGFLYARVPRSWVKINPPPKRSEMTEEQKQALAERGRKALAELAERKNKA